MAVAPNNISFVIIIRSNAWAARCYVLFVLPDLDPCSHEHLYRHLSYQIVFASSRSSASAASASGSSVVDCVKDGKSPAER